MAGYSKRTLVEKLGFQEGFTAALIGVPDGFRAMLGDLPEGVIFRDQRAKHLHLIHFFSRSAEELESKLPLLKGRMRPSGMLSGLLAQTRFGS